MRKKLSKNMKSWLATILGWLTTLATAYGVIDWNTFDLKRDWFKLIIIGLPALGGTVSSINQKDSNGKIN